MKKSKVVKKVKSKSSALPKRIKKYDDGGIQGLKKNPEYEAKMPAGITMPKGDMPYGTGMEMKGKSEPVPANKVLKKIEMPEGSLPIAPTAPAKSAAAPKAKLLPGGFTSEAQKASYIKNVKARMAKGATIDQLVKEKIGTKAGLEGLGLKDAAKAIVTVKTKKSITLPKNNVLSSVGRKGLANTASTPLPKNSKVPLKNATPKKGSNAAEALRLKGEGMKLKGKALATKGKKSYYKEQWNDNLLNKSATNKKLTSKEQSYIVRKYGHENLGGFAGASANDNLTPKQKKAYDKVRQAQLEKAKPEMRKALEESVMMMTPRGIAKQVVKKGGEFLFTEGAKKLIGQSSKQLATKGSQKALGEGIKSVAKTGSKALKPDKIIKPTTKALNSGQKMLGRTINVSGRTVSSGSQKALNSGQKLLNNGQTKLNAGQKLLQQGSKASKSTAAKINQVAKNRALTRNTRNAKVEAGIKTNNKVARSMRLKDETANLVKKGTQKVKTSVKTLKIKNAKPKPGDQLKLNLRRGGKK